uniref:Zinc-binding protein A33-like n=1 Tax=Crassostrea virginica TaxID=6565 RepID=A0A8B8DAQ8_CRAVI|nr:zinc-binding protein A33-like [Crassostrea virginica]
MDPKHSAQDVVRCDLCKTAIAQSYCDFCHVSLCRSCIGEHISEEYDKHKIVPILQRKSTLTYPKCEIHQNEVCQYQCKDCDIFVCSHCLASKQHKEHEFLKLEESFSAKKKHIVKDREELEEQILPIYEEIVIDLENQISNLDGEYKKLTSEMSKQREEIHREIDNAFDQMDMEIGEIKVKHNNVLQKHLDEIKQLQSLIQQTLKGLNEIEESNEVTSIIHYSSKNEQFSKLPPKVHISMPKFIPKQREKEELISLIGKLTPLSTTLEERVFTAKKPNTPAREQLDVPEVPRGVTCLNEEISTSGENAEMEYFNIQGARQKIIKLKSGKEHVDIWGKAHRRSRPIRDMSSVTLNNGKSIQPINKANQGIDDWLESDFKTKIFEESIIKSLTASQEMEIIRLRQNGVDVSVEKRVGQIRLHGLLDDVINASEKVYKVIRDAEKNLQEKQAAELLASMVEWCFLDTTDSNNLTVYPPNISMQLEKAFVNQETKVSFLDDQGKKYIVDLTTYEEYPEDDTRDIVKVIRRSKLDGM